MKSKDRECAENTEEMQFNTWRGHRIVREVRQTLDVRDFKGLAGYPWLVVAANPHLSAADLERYLGEVARDTPGAARSLSWVKRRRWMFQPPDGDNRIPTPTNLDGMEGRALETMAANPTMSARALSRLLKDRGITRSYEWVRQHRVDGMKVTTPQLI